MISQVQRSPMISSTRATEHDVTTCAASVAPASRNRIHIFLATSDIHLQHKLKITEEECLERAIQQCRPGNHLGDIGWAVQEHAEANGYSVVRDYVASPAEPT